MYDCIISLKEWQVYCKSHLHGPAFVYEEYIDCILVFIIRVCDFQKTNSDHFRKRKSCHATSVAIFWDSFSKILRPNLAEKNEWWTFWKNNHQNHISLCQIRVYLENFRLWEKIWPKERMMKIWRNRHWIHNQHKKSNSSAKFYLIWRIINFGYKFAQKIV